MAYEINCLDIGTTKITLLSGSVTERDIQFRGAITLPSKGIRKGLIIDMEEVVSSIKRTVKEAEERFNQRINSVITAISGNFIEIFESYGAVRIQGEKVSEKDIENALESASSVYIPLDRELLHVIPFEFIIDGESGIKNPLGMKAFRLEVKVQIITAKIHSVDNLIGACEQAGLKVEDIIFKPVALRRAVLSEDEIEEGVLLIDLGGGTTDIALFKDRRVIHTASIPVGGNHITNDLAIGLKIPVHEAEVLKIKYGSAIIRNSSEEIWVDSLRTKRSVPLRLIDEIISARVQEMLSLIKASFEETKNIDGISGIVITGGSSILNGLDTFAESFLGMPARIGYPDKLTFSGLSSSMLGPQNSLALGLLGIGSEMIRKNYRRRFLIRGILERLKNIGLKTIERPLSTLRIKKIPFNGGAYV